MARIMDYSYPTRSRVIRHRPDSLITRPDRVGLRRWAALFVPRCLVLLVATNVVCASAQEPITGNPRLSLLDAYQIARDSDPKIAIARYRVDGAVANRDVAKSKYFPQISLFGDWSQNKVNYQSTSLTQLDSQFYSGERYGLQLRSPLINVRHYREYERQDALVGQSEEELAVAETELLAEVVEAYLSVLLAEETALQFESELSALEQQLEEANALYSKSLLPVTQVLETQTRTDSLRADVLNARGQEAIARERLIQLMGERSVELQPIAQRVALLSSVGDVESAARLALEFDPATDAAEEAVVAARKLVEREKGSWVPEVDFVYNSQFSDVGFDNLTSPPRYMHSYSISMRYPLFEGGGGSARLRGAWAEFYSAQQQLEAAKRAASGRARAAWVNLESATERVQATRQAVKTAETNLDASRKAVQAGTARVTDVLLALAQNTRAQRDLNEARFQRAMGWLELELATGANPVALAPRFSSALHGL
jgi:TolC family type I secretion outer membrane protein